MIASLLAFNELAEFFASKIPAELIEFRPSEATNERVALLIFKEKEETLTSEEKSELDKYMLLDHLMRLAKAHARRFI